MDFLKGQAENFMNKDNNQQGQQAPGAGQAQGAGPNFSDGIQFSDVKAMMGGKGGINLSDGVDMSDVMGLAKAFQQTQQNPNANENDPNHVTDQLGGPQAASGAMNTLMNAFKQHTGQDFTGGAEQTNMLSSIAQQVTGTNIPPSLLGKMAEAKLGGML